MKSIALLIDHLEADIEFSQKIIYFIEFVKTKMKTFMIMNFGGVVLGLPLSLAAYYVTKKVIVQLRIKN